ncbi:DUF3732 domain-containing protein [Rubinisphaera sp.]|uniref:DUF3732 domain-containing protein n=1 Tax=Rubinisphaera sp. TaxID=2024857 RepID=UPI000C11B3CF|nr:DUF3732 domain-containing protein [Rubinisphaera sp.]MBV07908.1 hypothetical protein [Rubinisphaera sp.]|tara:strand:+ start:1245 stop:3287 length:2043 start_codon:yes stop_codon:yes gene_type:complete
MKMAILAVLLWPKDSSKELRQVKFEPSGINVVTGKSGTGKSSLLHIVDYCLGSGKCSIPVGHIRQTVSWFGVHLRLSDGEVVIARRNPGDQDQTGDVLWKDSVADPTEINLENMESIGIATLKRRFNKRAGLSDLGFEPGTTTNNFKSPVSFRDLAAFNFQPQHIVANPNVLFFKTDSFQHRETLVTIFPFVLGAVTTTQLVARWKVEFLEKELERKQGRLNQLANATDEWLREIRGVYSRARELGLLPSSSTPNQNWTAKQYLQLLQEIPASFAEKGPVYDAGVTAESLVRLRELEDEQSDLSRQIADRRRSLYRIKRLLSSVTSFGTELKSQDERLFGLGWFQEHVTKVPNCPLCGNENDQAKEQIVRLSELALELEEVTNKALASPPLLDRESVQLERDIRMLEEQLNSVQKEKWQLEDQSAELAERRLTINTASRFVGRIEQALESYWKTTDDSELQKEIESLSREITRLRKQANRNLERQKVQDILKRFSNQITAYVRKLQLARADDPVHLNIKELQLEVTSQEGRRDALWEIGSAENWMGYHIATLLTLHEMFLEQPASPVPSFLMIDQPSQAYFPDRWPGDDDKDIVPTEETGNVEDVVKSTLAKRSEDLEGVHRIFETLALAIEKCKGDLQIIVTEHAGPITWKDVPNVHLIENWRPGGDQYLIPSDWLNVE